VAAVSAQVLIRWYMDFDAVEGGLCVQAQSQVEV